MDENKALQEPWWIQEIVKYLHYVEDCDYSI